MALKNTTGFRCTTRDFINALQAGRFTARDVKPRISVIGVDENKILFDISVEMVIPKGDGDEVEVLLTGQPPVSLNHFELKLTGRSARLSPEEAEKMKRRIQELAQQLELNGISVDNILKTEEVAEETGQ